ncbi:MAG: DUF3822 family protein [Candidatus Limimorpha sp.]
MAASLIPYISCFDKVFDLGRTQSYQIAIQLRSDGFSFLVRDDGTNSIIALESYRFDEQNDDDRLLQALAMTLQKKGWDLNRFSSVRFIIGDPQNTLVPTPLYDEAEAATLLGFNHTPKPDTQICSDVIENAGCVNLYPVSNTLYKGLNKLGNQNRIRHHASIFIRSCLNQATSDTAEVHVHVQNRDFYMAVVKNGTLLFYNTFQFSTKDDFAYFLLLAMQQQGLSGQHVPIHLSGMISEDSDIVELCKRYIKDIRFVQPEASLTVSKALQNIPFHYYYLPYQSLSCAL